MFFLFFPHDTFSIIEALTKLILVLTGSVLIICFCHKITHYKRRPRYKFDHTFGRINIDHSNDNHSSATITTATLANAQHHQPCSTSIPLGPYAPSLPVPLRISSAHATDQTVGDNRAVAEAATGGATNQQTNSTFSVQTGSGEANSLASIAYDPYNTIRPFGIAPTALNPNSSFQVPSTSNLHQVSGDNNTYAHSSLVTIHNSRFHPSLQTQLQPTLISRPILDEQTRSGQENLPSSLECPSYEEAVGLISSTDLPGSSAETRETNSPENTSQNGTNEQREVRTSGEEEQSSSKG